MSLYHVLARRVMAPALDLIRGCNCMSCLEELRRTQWWSEEQLHALQEERLRELLQHAFTTVPYYREVMRERGLEPKDIRSALDLPKLPVLTKSVIRSRLGDLRAANVRGRDLLTSRTGGSTGEPLVFFTTRQDWYGHGNARGLLAMEWAGVALGDRIVSFASGFGAPSRLERAIQPLSLKLRRGIDVPLRSLSDESLNYVVQLLHHTRPRALGAYPSTLALIAAHIRGSGQAAPAVHAILTGGEQMFDHQRSLIREVFGLEPFSRYGSHENYVMATECEAHTGLHVFAQDLVVEVVDDDGHTVAPGIEGRILVTNLHARGMPFVRYDTGDVGSYAVSPCPCGRGMPLLDRLSGRRCDTIYTRSGGRFAGTGIGMSRFALLGVTQLQLVQEDLDHLIVRVVTAETSTPEARASVRKAAEDILRQNIGTDIDIRVQFVGRIEPSPAGKYVPVISKVDPNSWLKRATVGEKD